MDPSLISTVVINGCGKCRKGTFEHLGKCHYRVNTGAPNSLKVGKPYSNGVFWTAEVNISVSAQTYVSVYLKTAVLARLVITASGGMDTAFITRRPFSPEGKFILNMTEDALRSWAWCPSVSACYGNLSAVFETKFGDVTSKLQVLTQSLQFGITIPPLIISGNGSPALSRARMELHQYFYADAWLVRITGLTERRWAYAQWNDAQSYQITSMDGEYWRVYPPFGGNWTRLRVSDCLNMTNLVLTNSDARMVSVHGAVTNANYMGIVVKIRYGLGMSDSPLPGDTEGIVFITARSPHPIRLKQLKTVSGETVSYYTTSKGFIADPSRVLDLVIACASSQSALQWLSTAVGILLPNQQLQAYVSRTCSATASRAYWLVPQPTVSRRMDVMQMQVLAEFV
jgi:hypothetical protein